jgi:hypothetical protein
MLAVVAVALGLAVPGLVAASGTANADSPRSYQGNNWAQILTIEGTNSFNDYIVACDGEEDGHYVYANYHLVSWDGYSSYRNVVDDNGANNGCEHADWRNTKYFARAVRICEQNSTCGPWKYIPEALARGNPAAAASR